MTSEPAIGKFWGVSVCIPPVLGVHSLDRIHLHHAGARHLGEPACDLSYLALLTPRGVSSVLWSTQKVLRIPDFGTAVRSSLEGTMSPVKLTAALLNKGTIPVGGVLRFAYMALTSSCVLIRLWTPNEPAGQGIPPRKTHNEARWLVQGAAQQSKDPKRVSECLQPRRNLSMHEPFYGSSHVRVA
ncbi:hypothetical protein BX600DRAFT_436821 [Xylariales sp. PMI_506]|nr:hypothetical protein BX600DRAFT_436821 [Xylariales sp. PMI_506]